MSTTKPKFVCLSNPDQNSVRKTPIPATRRLERKDLISVLGAGIAGRLGRVQPLVTNPTIGMTTPMKADEPMPLTVRLRIIYATDDNGQTDGHSSPSKEALKPIFTALVDGMKQDWTGTGINFLFLPDCDFEIRKDTRLNRNFVLPADKLKTFPADESAYTQAQIDALMNDNSTRAYRNKIGAERPNTLLWLICEPNYISWDAKASKWVYLPHVTGSLSGGDLDFVVLNKWDFADTEAHSKHDASRAAHETGHFLHLGHTHREPLHDEDAVSNEIKPAGAKERLARWKKGIETWVDEHLPKNTSPTSALEFYDVDRNGGVNDTPADPGAGLMALANLAGSGVDDPLGAINSVTINPSHVTGAMIFKPDRNNPMSYYLDGAGDEPMRFSGDQIAVMRGALVDGNRQRLVAAQLGDTAEQNVRICAVWSPNTKGQGYSWGLSVDALGKKHSEMKSKGFHLSGQCAYVKNGVVLYDAFWDEGARNQHVIWGWLDKDVNTEVTKRAAEGWRVVHVHAYRHPGTGLRYNVVFEQGTGTQQVLLNKTQAELDGAWNTLMPTGMRMRYLDSAVDEKGIVRYAVVFVPGNQQQHYVAGWALNDIYADYDKQWKAGRRLASLSVVWTPDGRRYSGIWNPEGGGQLVMWLHVRERIREVYDEMWCQGFKLRAVQTVAV